MKKSIAHEIVEVLISNNHSSLAAIVLGAIYNDDNTDDWGFKIKEVSEDELRKIDKHDGIREIEHGGWIILLHDNIIAGPYADSDNAGRVLTLIKTIIYYANEDQFDNIPKLEKILLGKDREIRDKNRRIISPPIEGCVIKRSKLNEIAGVLVTNGHSNLAEVITSSEINYVNNIDENKSFQRPFEKKRKCGKCGGISHSVVQLIDDKGEITNNIPKCVLTKQKNNQFLNIQVPNSLWPHDVMAFVIYWCENCGDLTVKGNQVKNFKLNRRNYETFYIE